MPASLLKDKIQRASGEQPKREAAHGDAPVAEELHQQHIAHNIRRQRGQSNDGGGFGIVNGIETTAEHVHAAIKRQAQQKDL